MLDPVNLDEVGKRFVAFARPGTNTKKVRSHGGGHVSRRVASSRIDPPQTSIIAGSPETKWLRLESELRELGRKIKAGEAGREDYIDRVGTLAHDLDLRTDQMFLSLVTYGPYGIANGDPNSEMYLNLVNQFIEEVSERNKKIKRSTP